MNHDDDTIMFDGVPALIIWSAVGIVLMVVINVWFGALVWALCMRHVSFDRKPGKLQPASERSYGVAVTPVAKGSKVGYLCEDCVWTHATGEPKNPDRLHPCTRGYDELSSNWPTWNEDMGRDSLLAESTVACMCCSTRAKGSRIGFILS